MKQTNKTRRIRDGNYPKYETTYTVMVLSADLRDAGITYKQWAEQNGIKPWRLSRYLNHELKLSRFSGNVRMIELIKDRVMKSGAPAVVVGKAVNELNQALKGIKQ